MLVVNLPLFSSGVPGRNINAARCPEVSTVVPTELQEKSFISDSSLLLLTLLMLGDYAETPLFFFPSILSCSRPIKPMAGVKRKLKKLKSQNSEGGEHSSLFGGAVIPNGWRQLLLLLSSPCPHITWS